MGLYNLPVYFEAKHSIKAVFICESVCVCIYIYIYIYIYVWADLKTGIEAYPPIPVLNAEF